MLKSCKYCGRIHDSKVDCGQKPVRRKTETQESVFRGSARWKKKRGQILERDGHLCQLCLRALYDVGGRRFNTERLEVHHIVPLAEDFAKGLEDDNLITLCEAHHTLAENGRADREQLRAMASENGGTPLPFPAAPGGAASTTGRPPEGKNARNGDLETGPRE